MSLINDVLRDLQTREATCTKPLAGLRAVAPQQASRGYRWLLTPVLGIVLISSAWVAWRVAGDDGLAALHLSAGSVAVGDPAGQVLPVSPDGNGFAEPAGTEGRLARPSTQTVAVAAVGDAEAATAPRWSTLGEFAASLDELAARAEVRSRLNKVTAGILGAAAPGRAADVVGRSASFRPGDNDAPGESANAAASEVEDVAPEVRQPATMASATTVPAAHHVSLDDDAAELVPGTTADAAEPRFLISRSGGSAKRDTVSAAEKGLAALRAGKAAEAATIFRAHLTQDALDSDAWLYLARALRQSGRNQQAEEELYRGLTAAADPARLARALARLLTDRAESAEALLLLQAWQPSAADRAEHDAFVAALLQRDGRHAEAVAKYRGLLAAHPKRADWWVGLAIAAESAGQRLAALEAYDKAGTVGQLDASLRVYAQQRITALRQLTAAGS